jgi:hypothetical protein
MRKKGAASREQAERYQKTSFEKLPEVASRRKTQYFKIFGNRAIYHNGWMANTVPAVTPENGVRAPREPELSRRPGIVGRGWCHLRQR